MTTDQALAFVLFAIVAAGTPGPSNMILTSIGANVGIVRGLPTLLGVTAGMAFMLFVVAFGLGSFVLDHPLVLRGLKWYGIAFLLWLAWNIATAGHDETATSHLVGFWRLAAFQWVNPKSWLVCASAVATYLQTDDTGTFAQSAALSALFFVAAFPSCFVWLGFGASLQCVLRTERALRTFNVAMGALLAGSIALLVW
jgi:threonine/homoserine/homoserine lactone efflux protein